MKIVLHFYLLLVAALCFLSVVATRSAVEPEKDAAGKLIDSKLPKSSKANGFPEVVTIGPEFCQSCDVLMVGGVSGTFTSPNYPNQYCNLIDCSYAIKVDPSKRIQLTFTYFNIESGWDVVKVYDGSSVNDPLLLTASGYFSQPPVVNSTSNQMLVHFTTDGSVTDYGWSATYETFY